MTDNKKDNSDNLSHEDRVKGGKNSHAGSDKNQSSKDNNKSGENKSGHTLTQEERSRGGKNS